MTTARNRLRKSMPALKMAVSMAKIQVPDSDIMLAVVGKRADGSGQITASFEFEGFFNDLLEILGYSNIDTLVGELDSEGESA